MVSTPLTVPILLASDLTNIQLLELPPEVLAKLDSGKDPKLQIKSFDKPGSFAAICTEDETYKLVVHQTSNSVYVVQPTTSQLLAVAKAGSVLEMVAVAGQDAEGKTEAMLREKLIRWDVDQPPRATAATSACRTKAEIFADIPYSVGEMEGAWFRLCCFEDEHGCHIPDDQSLLKSWKALLTASAASSISITVANEVNLWAVVQEDNLPKALFKALLVHAMQSESDSGAALIVWTGRLLLDVMGEMDRIEFREEWSDLLPDTVVAETNIDMKLLKDYADLSDPTVVKSKRPAVSGASNTSSASTGASREWHEKFSKGKEK
jgi:Sister chromatid cohesion protein Dcc1